MTKKEFEQLEEEAALKEMHDDIHGEFIYIYNEIFDFCQENDLEPDAVLQIITNKLSNKRRQQIKKDGYISKI